MGNISIQRELTKVRPPRVSITYDVHVGNATEKKELPFVVGVLGDFSGNAPTTPPKRLGERSFIEINRDNFDNVLARMAPGLNLRVENTLEGDGSEIGVKLDFKTMKDFEPAQIVKQVEPLRKLLEEREKLQELKTKVDLEPDLEDRLRELLSSPDKLKEAGNQVAQGTETDSNEPNA